MGDKIMTPSEFLHVECYGKTIQNVNATDMGDYARYYHKEMLKQQDEMASYNPRTDTGWQKWIDDGKPWKPKD